MDLIKLFSPIRPSAGLKGEEKLEIFRFFFNLRVGDRI